ncbi:MAG: hypothetical protein WDA74_06340 [Spirochaetota bacterium]
MLKKLKRYIRNQLGISQLLQKQEEIIKLENEILKAAVFNSTITDSEWLKYKSFSPGGWAVDFSFLYTLYRVLDGMHPMSILEFGLGQSSKMILQYASFYKDVKAVTVEHNSEWISFFKNSLLKEREFNIKLMEIEKVFYKNEETLSYKNIEEEFVGKQYDFILVDGPFGSERYSRSQVISLVQNNLKKSFCIIIDDYDRKGEQETVEEIKEILTKREVPYLSAVYSGSKDHFLICSESLKFLTSL